MGSAICPPPGDENPASVRHFHGKVPWAARFALHPGMKIPRQFGIFTEKVPWAARFALHPGMKIPRQFGIFTEKFHGQRDLPSTRG